MFFTTKKEREIKEWVMFRLKEQGKEIARLRNLVEGGTMVSTSSTYHDWDNDCDECDFIANSSKGLKIHKARKH